MSAITRWDPFQNLSTLQEQVNRLFDGSLPRRADIQALTTWAPAVDIYETENELVLEGGSSGCQRKRSRCPRREQHVDHSWRAKVRGEGKGGNYLRVERTYGSFSRSFSLPNTVNTESIKADYKNGVLTVELPKRAESKPKQVKVNVTNGN